MLVNVIDIKNTAHNLDLLAGGLQPTRRRPAQLIPNGLQPHEHLDYALKESHPFTSSSSSKNSVLLALEWSPNNPVDLVTRRSEVSAIVVRLGAATKRENGLLLETLDKNVLKVLRAFGDKDIVLMRELSYVAQTSDNEAAMWMALGIPMRGWAPPANGMATRIKPPTEVYSEWIHSRSERNAKVLLSVKPSGDYVLDDSSFSKTMEEVKAGVICGPFYDLCDLKFGLPCLAPRHGIWEEHGEAVAPSVRNIDDLLFGEQNDVTGTMSSHKPTDVDALVAQVRAATVRFGCDELIGWKSDYSKAFKQVPSSPGQIEDFVVCQHDPHMQCPAYFKTFSQLFGGKSAPLNFSRYPEWASEVMSSLWAVPATSCVDDAISVERASTASSAREAWICFTSLTGWKISMEKSPEPSKRFIVIGVCLDLRPWPNSDPLVSVTEKRLESLDAIIRRILIAKLLACGQASSLAGKLGFTITAAFGRVGRAKLRPIINRSYSRAKTLDAKLLSCLLWWLRLFYIYRPRPIPCSLQALPTIISYSDGEGKYGGVGAAAWVPWLEHPVAVFGEVPADIRKMWAGMAGIPDYRDIYLVEAIGPLLLLCTFPRLMRNALWIHYVDNESAESSLISGTSALPAADHIVGLTWEICARRSLLPYFDRVESKANPVDGLSRGKMEGTWREVEKAIFPEDHLKSLASDCDLKLW